MLAQGTYQILGQLLALVHPAADLAHEALLLCFGLGLYILVVVGVGHGFGLAQICTLGHIADEHHMGAQIQLVYHLAADEGVDILACVDDGCSDVFSSEVFPQAAREQVITVAHNRAINFFNIIPSPSYS